MGRLSAFSSEELAEELARRASRPSSKSNRRIRHCDECENFIAGTEAMMVKIDDYNPCSIGHEMSFRLPQGYSDNDWGFYRAICRDRKVSTTPTATASGNCGAMIGEN